MDQQINFRLRITGKTNTGRTSLAQLIALVLQDHGIDVEFVNEDMRPEDFNDPVKRTARITALRSKQPKVYIEHVQANRTADLSQPNKDNYVRLAPSLQDAQDGTNIDIVSIEDAAPQVIVHATEDGRTLLESNGVKVEVQPVFSKEEAEHLANTIHPATPNDSGYVAVQVIDGVPVQAFKADEPEAAFANVPRTVTGTSIDGK
jgi:molybdopterin-guanine dinucleotide biosynthesis protein